MRVGEMLCAIPVGMVGETLRPLPVREVPGAASSDLPFLLGVARVRGEATPVIDLACLLGGRSRTDSYGRFVTVRPPGQRRCAVLAVDEVVDIRRLGAADPSGDTLPPLLSLVAAHAVERMSRLDRDFVLVLDSARLVPDSVWAASDAEGPAR
ncbi:MAG: chemotaxis protein CheW [Planctomycetota bacterium]